jgi:putative SOS response-associated peptidase YedK
MATTELDGLITRTIVILEKPADWEEWMFLRKDSANRHQLWSMVNPDLDEAALEKPVEPAAVEPEQYHATIQKRTLAL